MLWSRAAVFSLQLLDPKRVVSSAAAAGNWRFGRLVSVMASRVQINSKQNKKKEGIFSERWIYFGKSHCRFWVQFICAFNISRFQTDIQKKTMLISTCFLCDVCVFVNPQRLNRRSIIDNLSTTKRDIHFRFIYPVSEWGLNAKSYPELTIFLLSDLMRGCRSVVCTAHGRLKMA